MSSILLKLDYKQSSSSVHQSTRLNIEQWENKTIKDIKYEVQKALSIPTCDQRLFYPEGHLINDDTKALKSLYLRDGDQLYLEFLSVIDIKGMDELIDDLLEFAANIDQWKKDNMFHIRTMRNPSEFPNYDRITRASEKLAFQYFIPWKNPISVAQRHYFVQRGAFDKFLEVFKFAQLGYTCTYDPEIEPYCHLRDLGALVDYYNNEQKVLQMHCLSLLWNFSETDVDRKMVLKHNGLQMVCDALLRDPSCYSPDDNTFWVINSINETAVGCLVQYAEYPKSQVFLVNNNFAINKLVYMVECRLNRETTFYSLYSCQIAANTLFLCACSSKTPAILVKNNVHLQLIKLTRHLLKEDHDMALRYYCCLFLARIIAWPQQQLEDDTIKQVDELLELFLSEHTAEEVSKWEEQHNYVWVTILPFLSLTFTGSTITVNTSVDINGPGTRSTQMIGIFCLDHMSRLRENILLLVKEKLLPFITCLSWYLRENENAVIIKNILQRLRTSNPPSLSVIAKSQIARMKGLEFAMDLRV